MGVPRTVSCCLVFSEVKIMKRNGTRNSASKAAANVVMKVEFHILKILDLRILFAAATFIVAGAELIVASEVVMVAPFRDSHWRNRPRSEPLRTELLW